MRLKQITVEGLFNLYDYKIPLNIDERVTVIIAPNGYGKTTIFKLIEAAINVDVSYMQKIPFNVFKIEFEKETSSKDIEKICSLKVIKQRVIQGNDRIPVELIVYKITKSNGDSNDYQLMRDIEEERNDYEFRKTIRRIERQEEIERIEHNKWKDLSTDKILDISDLIKSYGYLVPPQYSYFTDYYKLKDELKDIKIHLIEVQRLMRYDSQKKDPQEYRSSRAKREPIPAVIKYSRDLTKIIEDKNSEYANVSQKRDSTFPHRLIQNVGSSNIKMLDEEAIYERIREIEVKNQNLMELGILESRESNDLPQEKMTDERRRVLTLYIEDTDIKLSVFDDLERKISLLEEIIDTQFSNKSIEVKKGKGFIFKLKNGEILTPDKLSSGEQHEVVINYELLFKTEQNSIILIDEPEISLHITWQEEIIKNLLRIAELSKLNIIIATHSPQIIDDRWDLTVDLEEGEGQ